MRTSKLASMGRMSTAVAHEIRNPLAAISQANALLCEDIQDPDQQRLAGLIGQNTKRLEKIVDDILNVARIEPQGTIGDVPTLDLAESAQRLVHDWSLQNRMALSVQLNRESPVGAVRFDSEHLRRVLINVLDNAKRHASAAEQSIQVFMERNRDGMPTINIWSDGAPMDQSVEQHLFEPFFSSDSRSSGLGLFICRELCDRHGASIQYSRRTRSQAGSQHSGNEFEIAFASARSEASTKSTHEWDTPWQATNH